MDFDIDKEIQELERGAHDLKLKKAAIDKAIDQRNAEAIEIGDFLNKKKGGILERELFLEFFKKPYVIIPQNKNSVLVAVPKFIKGFQVGWLWKETDSFFIYQFDQYSAWLGDAPADLLDLVGFETGLKITVSGETIYFDRDQRTAVKQKLGQHLRDVSDTEAKIIRGHSFDVIAETVKNGCLPFKPKPVLESDRRPAQHKFDLRPYQAVAVKKFLETGAVGVFHPTGAGKSFTAMHLMDLIKGKKLLLVPTKTLQEQWWSYIDANIPHVKNEIRIFTYSGFRNHEDEYALTIYDECQRLPADTFSRAALIKTKYRIGLSASPHREDGRENYIFALTGFPVGLNWQEYMSTVGKSYHPINVHVVRSSSGKLKKLGELLNSKKKTLIFCDTIEIGKQISREFDIPYIYGDTSNRLEEIANHKVVCISRVGDLGVSIKNLNRIIEVDFLFGSRQQELQRTGRLMHSEEAERHDIIMTESEISQHGKRLWALQEKGFTVKVNS